MFVIKNVNEESDSFGMYVEDNEGEFTDYTAYLYDAAKFYQKLYAEEELNCDEIIVEVTKVNDLWIEKE
jgi:hypothetical protein